MAEGLARKVLEPGVTVQSAGSRPAYVHPLAVQVLNEIGIDISSHTSKSVDSIRLDTIDLVITLCAEEVCPVLPHGVRRLHWPITDPAAATGSDKNKLEAFRAARDAIQVNLRSFAQSLTMGK